jgi:formylglycine-generating enzyme required for sulfatase activity
MADIFLSYARPDRQRAQAVAQALGASGWSVFWDPRILPGSSWDEVIEAELTACRCVVVLWSTTSVKSKWVKNEASVGDERGILVPVAIDQVLPPLAFRHRQTAQLQQWSGSLADEVFQHLLEGIAQFAPLGLTGEAVVEPAGAGSIGVVAVEEPDTAALVESAAADHRFRHDAWSLPDDELLGFVRVPAGPFAMGSDLDADPRAHADELPRHEVHVGEFFIGRFPVTTQQFMRCVEGGGCRPGDLRSLHGGGDCPVRYVSFSEAVAYCRWLEERLRSRPNLPQPLAEVLVGRQPDVAWHVTLPSEVEWEKAARGTDGRVYPWGPDFDAANANCIEAAYGGVTPVGSFPGGQSPYGLLDASGNVWEWTRSRLRHYPYRPDDGREDLGGGSERRVVRGGSFNDLGVYSRAASRVGVDSGERHRGIGFRVVIRPATEC